MALEMKLISDVLHYTTVFSNVVFVGPDWVLRLKWY